MVDSTDPGMDVSGLIAPWMQQNPWDMSQYGGAGQFGASMLAAAGPTPYKQPFLAGLGRGMLAGQQNALESAKQRMGLGLSSLSLQRQMAMWPLLMNAMQRLNGQGGQAPTADASSPGGSVSVGNPGDTDVQAAPNASPQDQSSAPAQSGGPPGAAPSASPAPWMGGGNGMNPMDESNLGAVFSLGGMPGGEALQKDAAFRAQYNPGLATTMALAKDPLMLDRAMMAEAARSGDSQGYLSAYFKMLTDAGRLHISSMSGNVTGFGLPPDVMRMMSNYNPQSGKETAGGRQSLIPGAAETEATLEGARAGAERAAQLGAETGGGGAATPAPGSASVPARPGRAAAATPQQAPQSQLSGVAAVNTPNYVPPVLAQAGRVPRAPGSTSPIQLKELQEGAAKEANETVNELQQKATEGQTLIAQVGQIQAAASQYPWTGRFADDRGSFLSTLQGIGWATPEQVKELGAYQDANKIAVQLQASATRQLGSREAAQVFTSMGKSIPSLTMSPSGLDKVSAYMTGIARYNQAQAVYAQRLRDQGNATGVNEVENTFITHSDPSFYIMASASPQSRAEFLSTMPQAKRTDFIHRWDSAIKAGLAPRPLDYQGQ